MVWHALAPGQCRHHSSGDLYSAPGGVLRIRAGLVAFIVNLIIAAWIKFSDGSKATPAIITVTLAVSMLFMIKSIVTWAGHIFDRRDAYSEALTQQVTERRAKAGGLPFDWHRVPCMDCDAPAFMPCGACSQEHETLLVRSRGVCTTVWMQLTCLHCCDTCRHPCRL